MSKKHISEFTQRDFITYTQAATLMMIDEKVPITVITGSRYMVLVALEHILLKVADGFVGFQPDDDNGMLETATYVIHKVQKVMSGVVLGVMSNEEAEEFLSFDGTIEEFDTEILCRFSHKLKSKFIADGDLQGAAIVDDLILENTKRTLNSLFDEDLLKHN